MRKLIAFLITGLGCLTLLPVANASPDQSQTFSMGQVLELGIAGGATVNDDFLLCIGTDCDYWLEYNSGSTQFEFWTTDGDGGGADTLVYTVSDGVDDIQTGVNKRLVIDDAANAYMTCTAANICRFNVEDSYMQVDEASDLLEFYINTARKMFFATSGASFTDDVTVQDNFLSRYGTSGDYWFKYNTGTTALELFTTNSDGGGTDAIIFEVQDATDDLVIQGGSALRRESSEYVHVTLIDVDDTPYTATVDDDVIVVDTDAGTGAPAAVTVNLPASACTPGADASCIRFVIKNIGGSSNVTVDADGAEEIDNAATQTLTPGDAITVIDVGQTDYHWIIE